MENTFGYSYLLYNETAGSGLNLLPAVKEYLGIDFSQHDNALNGLIKAVTRAVEDKLSITLIESRDVSVRWLVLNGVEKLPFQVVESPILVTSIDGSITYDNLEVISDSGGLAAIEGYFPNGVKIVYRSVQVPDNFIESIKPAMVRAVCAAFEDSYLSVGESVYKQFRGVWYNGGFNVPS